MVKLLVFTLVGLGAQIIDGTLGMAFGVTATTLLVLTGTAAAQASAAVHCAEVMTTAASGISHWRFGNVDWKVVVRLGIPGGVGSFLGATVLSRLPISAAAPITASILLAIGLYLSYRFSFRTNAPATARTSPHTAKFLVPLGLIGGFIDANGGGGWGPITTGTLLSSGKTAPRTIVGSANTSQFIVSAAASAGFLLGLGSGFLANVLIIVGLALGGVLAAPLAAWLVSRITPGVLGTAVGGLLILTNTRTLLKFFAIPDPIRLPCYLLILALSVALTLYTWRRPKPTPPPAVTPDTSLPAPPAAPVEPARNTAGCYGR